MNPILYMNRHINKQIGDTLQPNIKKIPVTYIPVVHTAGYGYVAYGTGGKKLCYGVQFITF
jgi:hypothetical protein